VVDKQKENKTAVIVDSSNYILPEDIFENNIYVIDDPIIFGKTVKYESDFISEDDFFKQLNNAPKPPVTSQPAPAKILEIFQKVKKDGYDSAIAVTLSSGISGTFQTVKNLAEEFKDLDILVWDSQIATIGSGNQALYAAGLLKKGLDKIEVIKKLEELRSSTGVYIAVDSIKHLQRTGRLSGGQALLAGMLSIKPILGFENGKIVAISKARQMNGVWQYIEKNFSQLLVSTQKPIHLDIIDANNSELSDKWAAMAHEKWPEVTITRGKIGPFIAVHTGEKSIGFIWSYDYKKLLGDN
jgi:DegV family protein with EDD domain